MGQVLTAEDLSSYTGRLVQQLHLLGEGSFAQVFQHPTDPNMVVKVFADDPVYLQYVNFCQRNPNNRWLPKVMELHRLDIDGRDDVWAVFMPRLRHATQAQVNQAFAGLVPWLPEVNKAFSERKRLSFPQWRILVRMADDPDTKTMATWMWRHFNRLDLLRQNFMMRDDQVVFNDPVASKE